TIENRGNKQQHHREENVENNAAKNQTESKKESQEAKHKSSITFSKRAVVTARRANLYANYTRHFRQNGKHHNRRHEPRIEFRNKCEREIQTNVGNYVAELVQNRAKWSFLIVFAREHAVHSIQCHAHEQHCGQKKQRAAAMLEMDHMASSKRKEQSGNRYLVSCDTDAREPIHDRPQQGLEFRFQSINAGHEKRRLALQESY